MPDSPRPYATWEMPDFKSAKKPAEKVCVIGYGNQGRAQALNIRDSGLPVVIGLREKSKSVELCKSDGFEIYSIEDATKKSTAVLILTPDEDLNEPAQRVMSVAEKGSILILAHGSSLYFKKWKPRADLDCGLVAPHGPGVELRRIYENGGGLPSMLALVNDATGRCRERLENIAAAIGSSRDGAGVRWSTLEEEVEVDLFVEQTLLVGGLIELLRAVVSTLVRAGYDPAVVRMSTIAEIGNMAAVYSRFGPVNSFRKISGTAGFGAATRGPRLIDAHTRRVLDDILQEIKSGVFAEELLSPEAPIRLSNYITALEESHLARVDEPFHPDD